MEKYNEELNVKKANGNSNPLISARKINLKQVLDKTHDLEFVREFNQVDYINDSKATSLESVFNSLSAIQKPVVWIMEANSETIDFTIIKNLVKQKVKAIICIGENKEIVIEHLLDEIKLFVTAADLSEAVNHAAIYSTVGDVVLFSPGTSANSLENNFKTRGENFKTSVNQLTK